MITANPPAYHQVIDIDDQRRMSGYSDDAKRTEMMLLQSIEHVFSTPAHAMAVAYHDDYETPPPQARRRMKVRFKLRGAAAPLPYDTDSQD